MGIFFTCLIALSLILFIVGLIIHIIKPRNYISDRLGAISYIMFYVTISLVGIITILNGVIHTDFVQNIFMHIYDYLKDMSISSVAWLFLIIFAGNVISYFASYCWGAKKYLFWLTFTISVCFWIWFSCFIFF